MEINGARRGVSFETLANLAATATVIALMHFWNQIIINLKKEQKSLWQVRYIKTRQKE